MFLLSGFILSQTYLYFIRLFIICLLDTNYFLSSNLTLWIKLCGFIIHNSAGQTLWNTGSATDICKQIYLGELLGITPVRVQVKHNWETEEI